MVPPSEKTEGHNRMRIVYTSPDGPHMLKSVLSKHLGNLRLGECRKLFRHRAAKRGVVNLSTEQLDEAIALTVCGYGLPDLFQPTQSGVALDEKPSRILDKSA